MTRDELLQLPTVVSVPVAADAFGMGVNKAYELIRDGTFPVAPLRVGRLIKIPTESLREALGISPRHSESATTTVAPIATTTSPATKSEGCP
ncbi:helix-turn-helix domain-containing protein [Jatrophihabitans sp. DSM 45814]